MPVMRRATTVRDPASGHGTHHYHFLGYALDEHKPDASI
jgi:hypothetical protein